MIVTLQLNFIVFYDKPFLKFERLLETYVSFAPRGFQSFRMAMPIWLREKLFQKDLLREEFKKFDTDFDGIWKPWNGEGNPEIPRVSGSCRSTRGFATSQTD